MIFYILQNFNNQKLTETKLQKLLYFCDFGHFQEKKTSITGFQYRKNIFGPTIINLPQTLKEMEATGLINVLEGSNYFGTPQKTFSIASAKIVPAETFSSSELLTIDRINDAYKELTPREISRISHLDFPYLATKNQGNVIKYELTYYRENPGEDLDLADEEAVGYFTSNSFAKLIRDLDGKLQRIFHQQKPVGCGLLLLAVVIT